MPFPGLGSIGLIPGVEFRQELTIGCAKEYERLAVAPVVRVGVLDHRSEGFLDPIARATPRDAEDGVGIHVDDSDEPDTTPAAYETDRSAGGGAGACFLRIIIPPGVGISRGGRNFRGRGGSHLVAGWLADGWKFLAFAIQTAAAVPVALKRHPGEVLVQFEQVFVRSLPIVAGAGLSVGLVTWLQTHRLLVQHGAESTLPSFLAVAVLVEIGPILAGLLVASRMGAGLSAELGTMVLNEEIDARLALGVDPVPSLVAPRAIACAVAVPLLTVVLDAGAMLGGLAAELSAGGLTARLFWSKSLAFLDLADILPATLKTAVFGLLIGLAACWTGLNAGSSAEAVGQAAIRGVVRSVLVVFASNVVMVPLIQWSAAGGRWSVIGSP